MMKNAQPFVYRRCRSSVFICLFFFFNFGAVKYLPTLHIYHTICIMHMDKLLHTTHTHEIHSYAMCYIGCIIINLHIHHVTKRRLPTEIQKKKTWLK